MKKVLILSLMIILLLSGCKISRYEGSSVPQDEKSVETQTVEVKAFSFREHKFWDTLEKVVEREGTPDRDIKREEDAYTIIYDDIEIFGYQAELSFSFLYNNLHSIDMEVTNFSKGITVEQRHEDIKSELIKLCDIKEDLNNDDLDDGIVTLWINYDLKYILILFTNNDKSSFGVRTFGETPTDKNS